MRFYGSNAHIILLKSIVPKENHVFFMMVMMLLMLMMLMYRKTDKHVYTHIISMYTVYNNKYTHILYTHISHICSIIGNKHILIFQWDLVFTIPWAIPPSNSFAKLLDMALEPRCKILDRWNQVIEDPASPWKGWSWVWQQWSLQLIFLH